MLYPKRDLYNINVFKILKHFEQHIQRAEVNTESDRF